MVVRRNKPGLIGRAASTAARTALITATASTVANRMAPKAGAPAAAAAPAQPAEAAPVQAAPQAMTSEAIAQLQKLAELNKAGILTDEEFATQKARLLG